MKTLMGLVAFSMLFAQTSFGYSRDPQANHKTAPFAIEQNQVTDNSLVNVPPCLKKAQNDLFDSTNVRNTLRPNPNGVGVN